jgi:hypothetical protein
MNADDCDCKNTGKTTGNMLDANSSRFASKVKQNQIADFFGKKREGHHLSNGIHSPHR